MSFSARALRATLGVTLMACLASCGDGRTNLTATETGTRDLSAFTVSLSPCPDGPTADGPDPIEFLSRPGSWYRISQTEATTAEDPSRPSSLHAAAEYIGGDTELEAAARASAGESVEFHGSASMTSLIVEAEAASTELYVKTEGNEGVPLLRQSVAFDEAGDFAFVGECWAEKIVAPLVDRFGSDTTSIVRSLVGANASSAQEVLGLNEEPAEEPQEPLALNPEYSDPELLAGLDMANFTLAPVPDSWVGPYTVCPKIEEGWSNCFDLSDRTAHGSPTQIFYNAGRPTVEFWLTDQSADLTRPLALLGTVDLTEQIALTEEAGTMIEITMTLPEGTTPDDIVGQTEAPVRGVSVTAAVSTR